MPPAIEVATIVRLEEKPMITKIGQALAIALCLAACSSTPNLSSQQHFNLSGRWQLVEELSDAAPSARQMMEQVGADEIRRQPSRRAQMARINGAVFAFVAQDFPVLQARSLRIEQNSDSMGIDYEPGTYRDVSWGYRERGLWEVYAGWDEQGALVIDSRSSEIRGVEQHVLRADGLLEINVVVNSDQRDLSLRRVYARI